MTYPPSHQDSPRHSEWIARVQQLESEGLDTSDAQGIADMEIEQTRRAYSFTSEHKQPTNK